MLHCNGSEKSQQPRQEQDKSEITEGQKREMNLRLHHSHFYTNLVQDS